MKHAIHKHTHTVVVFVLLLLRFMPEAMMKCAEKSTQGRRRRRKTQAQAEAEASVSCTTQHWAHRWNRWKLLKSPKVERVHLLIQNKDSSSSSSSSRLLFPYYPTTGSRHYFAARPPFPFVVGRSNSQLTGIRRTWA